MPSLLVIRGPNIGMRYELGDRTRVGRAPDNEIQVPDGSISRVHAEILKNRLAFTVHDRESTNGVVVNGVGVREKLLARGDEIQVGNTLFLFNAEINIRNARFSNNSVYLYSADAQTVVMSPKQGLLDRLGGAERQAVDFIMRLAEWFSAPPARVNETAERLLHHLMDMFMADNAVLMLRDPDTSVVPAPGDTLGRPQDPDRIGRSLRPIVALPEGVPMRVNRELVSTAARDRTALLASERSEPPAAMGAEMTDLRGSAPASAPGLSTICAPLLDGDEVVGMIVVEKNDLDFYSLRDLGLLQAIGCLTMGAMHAARLVERIDLEHPGSKMTGIVPSLNPRVQELFRNAQRASQANVSIMISGESGTGKEVLARFIHQCSPRARGPFVPLNCGAIPATLFESELFGYERGAFTGAVKTTAGKVEVAHGGTLFLDEIGELDMALQPKLLRFLQDHAFYRVGGTRAVEADVRIIAATNASLEQAVEAGRFREDLWYRLNVVNFEMPPLRRRREDIPGLVDYLVRECAPRLGKRISGVTDEAMQLLQDHRWRGNVRELANAVERAVLLCNSNVLHPGDFGLSTGLGAPPDPSGTGARRVEVLPLSEVERREIIRALRAHAGNQMRAAEALGVHRNTLRNKIVEYGIDTKDLG